MADFADLQPCNYFPIETDRLLAVGWLERDSNFTTGAVDEQFFVKLQALCREAWQPVVFGGMHACSLCQFDPPRFYLNVFVPYAGYIHVAPVAVVHYVSVHWYKPPQEFIDAVMSCPAMNSMEYKKAILSNGGRGLVQAANAS